MTLQITGPMRTVLALAIASSMLAGCGSNDSPAPATGGGKTVNLSGGIGGNGTGNYGGSGNDFRLDKEAGAGDVKVLRAGSVSAAFTALSITPSFGAVPAVVSTNTDLSTSMLTSCADTPPAADTLYQVSGQNNLYKSNGVTVACEVAEVVTGLDVTAGATLTLGLNSGSGTSISTTADIRNNGTIRPIDVSAAARGNLSINSSSYVGTGKIETNGTLPGQLGGNIDVNATYGLINSGSIIASGAASSTGNGGNAGTIELNGSYYTQNSGILAAVGGSTTAAAATGGNAQYIDISSNNGPVYNSGNLSAHGGSGATGGNGADVYLDANEGNLFNSGHITAYGANSAVGNGGYGGYISFNANMGEIRNSGDVKAWGGDTTDLAGSGGNGNQLYVYSEYDGISEYSPAGDIYWSGEIDMHGGSAVATGTGNGGSAGDVYAEIYGGSANISSKMLFVGYGAVNAFGGDGNNGGIGGSYKISNNDSYVYGDQSLPAMAGNVVSEANIVANGGNARADGVDANGNGGSGGSVDIETDYYPTAQLVPDAQKVSQLGDINVSGGNGRNQTSSGINSSGDIWLWGYNGVSSSGKLTINGGNDLGTTTGAVGFGGQGKTLWAYSELGDVNVSGTLVMNGGNGNYRGGYAGGANINGNTVHVTGTATANGGNARVAELGSVGGNGGYMWMKATQPQKSSATITASYAGGTGATAGTEGSVMRLIFCTGTGCSAT